MKQSAYERAVEIKKRLEYLEDLIGLLNNATNQTFRTHKLAAIRKADDYDTTTEIVNDLELDLNLREKFIKIIQSEQKVLQEEFENL